MYLDIHTHFNNKNAIKNTIVSQENIPKNQNFSLGIHPWYISDTQHQLELLETELKQNSKYFLFIGECGLDKLKGVEFEIQKTIFIAQIKLSEKYQKPLIIHCVKAFNELLVIYNLEKPKQPWIIHGYNKKIELAQQLINRNIYLSFGSSIIKSNSLQEVIQKIPVTQIFLETDNDNTLKIEELYSFVSRLLKIENTELKKQIETNLWKIIG